MSPSFTACPGKSSIVCTTYHPYARQMCANDPIGRIVTAGIINNDQIKSFRIRVRDDAAQAGQNDVGISKDRNNQTDSGTGAFHVVRPLAVAVREFQAPWASRLEYQESSCDLKWSPRLIRCHHSSFSTYHLQVAASPSSKVHFRLHPSSSAAEGSTAYR